jgi:hypothetical protein
MLVGKCVTHVVDAYIHTMPILLHSLYYTHFTTGDVVDAYIHTITIHSHYYYYIHVCTHPCMYSRV